MAACGAGWHVTVRSRINPNHYFIAHFFAPGGATTSDINWGDPVVNFNAGTFGRITTQAGAPRIIQLGVKYDF